MAEIDDLKAAVARVSEEIQKVIPAFDDVNARLETVHERLGAMDNEEAEALKAEVVAVATQLTALGEAFNEAFSSLEESDPVDKANPVTDEPY